MKETTKTRKGEEIDPDNLAKWLKGRMADGGELAIEQFPAGSSNLTYLVKTTGSEYVLRRPPFGNTVKSAHDMSREFNVLSKLSAVYPPAPKPLLYCDDESVIGSEFYLMERRRGLIVRGAAPAEIAASPDLQREVCRSFIKNLAHLHSLDLQAAGLDDLGRPEGYVQRQVEGWTKRYFNAKTDEWPELEGAITWLNANIPADTGAASLIHNDYKFDNVMLDPADLTWITAVLDWEMVTIGDPLMDLGTTLGYWMDKEAGDHLLNMPFNPRVLMENITREKLVEMYREESGTDAGNILFYYVFGTFKIAVIAQQIYARFARGATSDPRFAGFNHFVAALGKIAARTLSKDRM